MEAEHRYRNRIFLAKNRNIGHYTRISRTLHYTVNTLGDCRADHANDRLVYSLYYPPHDRRAARIKECCVDNAVGLDGHLWCAQQPEVQSKVDVCVPLRVWCAYHSLFIATCVKWCVPPAMAAEALVKAEHQLNLARSIRKMATKTDDRLLAISDALYT